MVGLVVVDVLATQTDAVRSKEMMEARVDAVFASIVADPEFVSLTDKADGKLPMPARSRQ